MKELKIALKYVIKVQLALWAIFMVIDECKLVSKGIAEQTALIVGALSLLVVFVLYFKHDRKIIKKNKLKPFKFNVFLYLSWGLLGIIITFVEMLLVENEIIHVCTSGGWSCFLNGIEYAGFGFGIILLAIIIIGIELIILFIKKLSCGLD